MKILVVEDEPSVLAVLKKGFEEEGFEFSAALDGTSGWNMFQEHTFDIILLDIMLPGINGLELVKKMREQDQQTPIFMLTALSTSENIVTCLNHGADDYIVKPFRFKEMIARIKAVRRRVTPIDKQKDGKLQIADLEVDSRGKTVTRAGKRIDLTAKEYALLELLLQNKNVVISRQEILNKVWDINFNLGTNVVNVYINFLRSKIDKNHTNKLIHTVVGMGYVIRES